MQIETTERIFRVETFESDDEIELCNIDRLSVVNGQLFFNIAFGSYPVKSIKHYWNNNFVTIGKKEVVEMIKAR